MNFLPNELRAIADAMEKHKPQIDCSNSKGDELTSLALGEIMKETRGRVNPKLVREILRPWFYGQI